MMEDKALNARGHITTRQIAAVLAVILFCVCGIEAVTRFAFGRISRIERRIMTERASVLQLAHTPSVRSAVLIGDSLLLEDIDMTQLERAAPAGVRLQRFSIEATGYLDWLYGLRQIFSDGVRPSTVILCLNPNSFISNEIKGDYSAYYLYQAGDIPALAKRAGYDLTKESSLLFAHYSLFFAGRAGLRNFMLSRVDPSYGLLLHNLLMNPARPISRDVVLRMCESRFQELEQLCTRYSTRFVYVMPPGFGIHEDAIVEAASRAHISLLVPVHTNGWPLDKFSDGMHLNQEGARQFTQLLSPSLAVLLRSSGGNVVRTSGSE